MNQEVYQDLEPAYIKEEALSYLYDWFFHFNHINAEWSAIPREFISEYFNNYNSDRILRSTSLDTLREILHINFGDAKKIKQTIG